MKSARALCALPLLALFGNVPTASLTGDLWGELIDDASNRANR